MRPNAVCPICSSVVPQVHHLGAADPELIQCPHCNHRFRGAVAQASYVSAWFTPTCIAGVLLAICYLVYRILPGTELPAQPDGNTAFQAEQVAADNGGATQQVATVSALLAPAELAQKLADQPGTTSSAAAELPATQPNGDLDDIAYRWVEGAEYSYQFSIEAEVHGQAMTVAGTTTHKAGPLVPPEEGEDDEESGTGTGFVVHPDGYLITCAHVVEGATSLQVNLGGAEHTGEIVALDKEHDLALVRIQASGLSAMELADSDAIELGQEVRVVGFPLTNILGSSLKVSRGTVAGIIAQDGSRLLQVDASVNAGNSGGPLVNARGEVIGITSSKLAGAEISNVGFAVAINDAVRLLRSSNISHRTTTGRGVMDGPQLTRHVAPSIALLTCVSRVQRPQRRTLEFTGQFASDGQTAAGQAVNVVPTRYESGRQVVSDRGEVIEGDSREQLPLFLGAVGRIALEPLPPRGRKRCETQDVISVRYQKFSKPETPAVRDEWDTPFGLRSGFVHRPPIRSPFARRPFGPPGFPRMTPFGTGSDSPEEFKTTEHPATLRTRCELASVTSDKLVFKKTVELKTMHPAGEEPLASQTGTATIEFDRRLGMPIRTTYKGMLTLNEEDETVQIPFTMTYELADARQPSAVKPAVVAPQIEDTTPKELTAEYVAKLIEDLKSGEYGPRHLAVHELGRTAPLEGQRTEVAAALVHLLTDSDAFLRRGAISALGIWGTAEHAAELRKLLEHRDVFTRLEAEAAIEQLTRGKASAEEGSSGRAEFGSSGRD